jgi:putative endonuclease
VPRRLTKVILRVLDWLIGRLGRAEDLPKHQQTGRLGEEAAYFHLRQLRYVVVAKNFRSPRRRGEIDLIAWEGDTLCFVEVKTRTTRDVKPAHLAVDREKQRELIAVAHEYLHHFRQKPAWRVDVLSVYFEEPARHAHMELFRNAFPVA